jgi:hypothetical protein
MSGCCGSRGDIAGACYTYPPPPQDIAQSIDLKLLDGILRW